MYDEHTCLGVNQGNVGQTASFVSHVKFPIGLDMHTNAIPRLSLSIAPWTAAKKAQIVMDIRQDLHNLGLTANSIQNARYYNSNRCFIRTKKACNTEIVNYIITLTFCNGCRHNHKAIYAKKKKNVINLKYFLSNHSKIIE